MTPRKYLVLTLYESRLYPVLVGEPCWMVIVDTFWQGYKCNRKLSNLKIQGRGLSSLSDAHDHKRMSCEKVKLPSPCQAFINLCVVEPLETHRPTTFPSITERNVAKLTSPGCFEQTWLGPGEQPGFF